MWHLCDIYYDVTSVWHILWCDIVTYMILWHCDVYDTVTLRRVWHWFTTVVLFHRKCILVHADLSEYNLLWHEGQVYFIDVSQSVDLSHPRAHDFLLRDCKNVINFFSKHKTPLEVRVIPSWLSVLTGSSCLLGLDTVGIFVDRETVYLVISLVKIEFYDNIGVVIPLLR